jgi:hypothetical protein
MKAPKKVKPIANQIFVGLPWKTIKPKYEKCIKRLKKKFPVNLCIIGWNDERDAVSLFDEIKAKITSSSEAFFDATGGNPNVSLEYGFAEGINLKRTVFVNSHKGVKKKGESAIISDLAGKRRVQYANEKALSEALESLCQAHDFTKRFEAALRTMGKGKQKGEKKSLRALALSVIREFDSNLHIPRKKLVDSLMQKPEDKNLVSDALKGLIKGKVISAKKGIPFFITIS